MANNLQILSGIERFVEICERGREPHMLVHLADQTSLVKAMRQLMPEQEARTHPLLGRLTILMSDYPQFAHG